MKQTVDYESYDTLIQATDWRYSASVLGLLKYFRHFHGELEYALLSDLQKDGKSLPSEAISGFDGILYHSSDITEERYLDFVEKAFESEMTHLKMLAILEKDTPTDDEIKDFNDKAKSKTVLKNLFGKTKFNGTNREECRKILDDNRLKIVKEIYRYSPLLYRGFNNTNLLLTESNPHCRLQSYTVDEGRKTRYIGYSFDKDTFVGNDCIEFDFIPFAFTNTYESYFINNNFDVGTLKQTNEFFVDALEKVPEKNIRTKLYLALKNSGDYMKYDVEVIIKPRDMEQYQTLFVRADRLKALQELKSENLKFNYKISDNYYFNLENEVYEKCLNNELLDNSIMFMLKVREDKDFKKNITFQIYNTILINEKWKGAKTMYYTQLAKEAAIELKKRIIGDNKSNNKNGENKLNAYRQKIISAMIANDYERVNDVIISLCNFQRVVPEFAIPFFENPEKNIGIIQTFVAYLIYDEKKENNNDDKENE